MSGLEISRSGTDVRCLLRTGSILPGVVTAWCRRFSLEKVFEGDRRFAIEAVESEFFSISWCGLGRGGDVRRLRARVSVASGEMYSDRPAADWSEPAETGSRVVVAPDMVTFWHLVEAVGSFSVYPFVIAAPTGSGQTAPGWEDRTSWRFRRVTLLADNPSSPPPLLRMLARVGTVDASVAVLPRPGTWWEWAKDRRLRFEDLEGIEAAARPLADFAPIRVARPSVPGSLPIKVRELDAARRLGRLVEGVGGPAARRFVRSDRTCVDVLEFDGLRAGRGPSRTASALSAGWSGASVERFLEGADDEAPIGDRLSRLLQPLFGAANDVCRVAAWIVMTHVFPAIDDLPVLLVRGGTTAQRSHLRRLLTSLCHAPLVAARSRAVQLARLVDAGDGALLLDEPGPLVGPNGPTEIGRFLERGSVRGASSWNSMTGREGLRTLEVFGPKTVIAASAAVGGLACTTEIVDLIGDGATPPVDQGPLAELRDDLYRWSLRNVALLVDAPASARRADTILATIARLIPIDTTDLARAAPAEFVAAPPRSEASPGDQMREVLLVCGSGGQLAMAEVVLEIAARGIGGEALTPERVGRWLALQPEVDAREMTRRRLHGQISRIYPLRTGAAPARSDPLAAFDFCLKRACADCRYDSVCEAVLPGMKERKNRP